MAGKGGGGRERKQEKTKLCSYATILSGGTQVGGYAVVGAAMAAWYINLQNFLSVGHQLAIYLTSSHPPATPMASVPKYHCPCFKCRSMKKERVKRTILVHSKENLAHLNNLRASREHLDSLAFVEDSHNELMELLHNGEFDHLFIQLASTYLLMLCKYWTDLLRSSSCPLFRW